MTHYVYGLYDPSTGALRYIGKTTDLVSRLAAHMAPQAAKPVRAWIRGLGKQPILRVLAEYQHESEALIGESALIREHRERGASLLNSRKRGSPAPGRRHHFNGFGQRVLALRTRLGLSGLELERVSGICPMTIHRIERSERGVTADTAVLLARALNVSVEWLVTGEERASAERAA